MELKEDFVNNLWQSQSVFDVVGVCYCELLKYVKDSEVRFIMHAVHMASEENLEDESLPFEKLRTTILALAQQIDANSEQAGIGFSEFRTRLLQELNFFACSTSLSGSFPICIFYVLEALDSYVENHLEDVRDSFLHGPLNKGQSRKHCLVYLQEHESFLSGAYTVETRNGFRKPYKPTRIGTMFRTILLMQCDSLPCVPVIKPVLIPERADCKKSILQDKRFRIASIPYIGFDTFKFHEKGKSEPCSLGSFPEGEFYVDYPPELETQNIERIERLLGLAIRREANIVIFPEFIMSDSMRNTVASYLRNLEPAKRNHLLLVIAGTSYRWDGESEGDNILYMYNSRGVELGKYYKYSPFIEQSEQRFHGTDLFPKKDGLPNYIRRCEILSNPGQECTILDIAGIGRLLPAICRDVIDGDYTLCLAKSFVPSLIMTPAWSPSITGFDNQFASIANTIHTMSLLCNCCNAVPGVGEKRIGTICVPQKKGTSMDAKVEPLIRREGCGNSCQECGGCMIQIDVDFSGVHRADGTGNIFFRTD